MHASLRSTTLCALIACVCVGGWLAPARSEAQQGGGSVQARVVSTERMEMELVPERPSIQPGGELWVALRMRTDPGWYTYWRFGGDAGEGATIEWRLPEGFSADGIVWPYPRLKVMERAAVYIYEDETFLLSRLKAPADLEPGQAAEISARIDYIVCDEEGCYPEELEVPLQVPVTAKVAEADPRRADAFYETWARVPVEPEHGAGWELGAVWRDDRLLLRAKPPAGVLPDVDGVHFFAGIPDLIDHSSPQRVSYHSGVLLLELEKSAYAMTPAERAAGALVVPVVGDDGIATALKVDVPILGMDELSRLVPVDAGGRGLPPTLWLALGLAFIGGLLLNLMPCVFPVVSLKVLGFMRLAGERPAEVRRHGFSFAAGVLVAFWALAGLLILLRHAGEEIGWGFQLQSPGFIALMTFLLFAIGLSLAGVFEVGTSFGRLANLAPRASGYTGSALSGMLATIVATPCTAPFMGAALGFALTLSAAGSLLIFTSLALGMAAPYVVLSLAPALLRYLPRPGGWMETFKQALAFPLFATAAWLVWVFGHQTGVDGVLRLLLGLTFLAMAGWCWGRFGSALSASRASRLVGRTVAAALLLVGLALALGSAPLPAATGGHGFTTAAEPSGAHRDGARIQWEEFSAEAVSRHREAGRVVFIDFTAAWCLTCKVNERVALNVPEVVALVEDLDIAMLKADWTTRDPAITRALGEFGRSGVPLYVVYSPDPFEPPRLLPEVLTPAVVIRALQL
jgi:thiol:disulfide interchange protein/DsbC/DsbD-like thiol-disulfide interchange protein